MIIIRKEKNRDYSISCARFVAMIFIVACHVMERDDFSTNVCGAHISWAFWFNVGVQMFLFISGFLYGRKDKIDVVEFYKKGLPKLLIDYYVFIFGMLLIIHVSPLMSIDKNGVIGLLTVSGTVPGLGHLWFMPTILLCYFLTPIILPIIKAIDRYNNIGFFALSIVLIIVFHYTIKHYFSYFSPAYTNCFVIGMIYSRVEPRKPIKTILLCLLVIACFVIIPVQFRIDYWPHGDLPEFFSIRYSYFTQYGHCFLGIILVVLIRYLYRRLTMQRNTMLLDWSDKYSYDVYLVHHVFIQSAFACVQFISNRWIAIPLALLLTVLSSMLLRFISQFVKNVSTLAYRKALSKCDAKL